MNFVPKMNRRSFVVSTAAVGGGLALGLNLPFGGPDIVRAADGSEIGTADSVLGDQNEDIFHGLVVKRHDGQLVEIAAVRVKKMTATHVITDLDPAEARSLTPYRRR